MQCDIIPNQRFHQVSLPIPGGTGRNYGAKTAGVTLEACFEEFTKKEKLEHVNCDNCKKNRTQEKGMSLQILPEILVLHLVRFDQTGRFSTKITSSVQCPVEGLSVDRFCAGQSNRRGVPMRYDLFAVAEHDGRMGFGHCTASCGHPENAERWFQYNDCQVTPSRKSVTVTGAIPYLLFYRRRETAR